MSDFIFYILVSYASYCVMLGAHSNYVLYEEVKSVQWENLYEMDIILS